MSILLIVTLLFIAFVGVLLLFLRRMDNYKLHNYWILGNLLLTWVIVGIFIRSDQLYVNYFSTWALPFLYSIFYFVQTVTRVPFAMISRRFKSRTLILKIVLVFYLLVSIIAVSVESPWVIWLIAVGSGALGSTFGLQTQYHAEHWNIRKIYQSVAIVYTLPFLGNALGEILLDSFNYEDVARREIWIIAMVFGIVGTISVFLNKEKKHLVWLDDRMPKALQYEFGKKEAFNLYLNVFLISFTYNLVNNNINFEDSFHITFNERKYWLLPFSFIAIFCGFLTATFVLKTIGSFQTKLIGYFLLFGGIFMNLTHLFADERSSIYYLVGYTVLTLGFTMLYITYFGAALHADVKNRELISAIFLTINSLAVGLAYFISNAIIIVVTNLDLALQIVFSIALGFCGIAVGVAIFYDTRVSYIFRAPIAYEFHLPKGALTFDYKINKPRKKRKD